MPNTAAYTKYTEVLTERLAIFIAPSLPHNTFGYLINYLVGAKRTL
jgi:hypothetical protein